MNPKTFSEQATMWNLSRQQSKKVWLPAGESGTTRTGRKFGVSGRRFVDTSRHIGDGISSMRKPASQSRKDVRKKKLLSTQEERALLLVKQAERLENLESQVDDMVEKMALFISTYSSLTAEIKERLKEYQ